MARTADSTVPWAVIMTTAIPGRAARSASSASIPSRPGIFTSRSASAYGSSAAAAIAASAPSAVPTT
jgi:hypothetical protein